MEVPNDNALKLNVTKKDGAIQEFSLEKLEARLKRLSYGLSQHIDIDRVIDTVANGLYDLVTTSEIDQLSAETAAMMITNHPDYSKLASRVFVARLHSSTSDSFLDTVTKLNAYINPKTNKHQPKVSDELVELATKYKQEIDEAIDYNKDLLIDYFGLKTLEKSYLQKINKLTVERPQHMWMRVSLGIHGDDWKNAKATYEFMSSKYFTHATPTLFNAGTPNPQMSSCFLIDVKDDSIEGIYDTLKQTALISQAAGGVGLNVHKVRASGSYIGGTGGTSNGIVPMLRVFNDTARYVDQGGGKRKGSFAIYLEPWHADVLDFLDLKKNTGKEEMRARDLFFALWISDLFMERFINDEMWTLMCPNECPGLDDVYGDEFEALYTRYELEGKGRKTMKARDLMEKIAVSQIETGTPFMGYKDSINKKSNQKNLGTIKSSNLCIEIVEYSSPEETAVCNLASIALPMFVENDEFNHQKLHNVARQVARNLNKVIDRGSYPTPECRVSNMKHRPIGIGVQGLADVFFKLGMAFDSNSARILNRDIHETIYHAALTESNALAIKDGAYSSFAGSPASEGILQFHMWGVSDDTFSGNWNWTYLIEKIKEFGLRNSLTTASMPTASTASIFGNNEANEIITSNLYTRRTLSGEHIMINNHLHRDLTKRKLWTPELRMKLMAHNGSVQNIDEIPMDLKEIYRTVWEVPIKSVLEMARDRAWFLDQTQSMNVFMKDPTSNKVAAMHKYGYQLGLKTGMYYLRSNATVDAIKFTVDKSMLTDEVPAEDFAEMIARSKEAAINGAPEDCEMCGS